MLKTTTSFQKAYNHLNLEQKKAVEKIDGPVMVIAGPGTGKTQILATRIAQILLSTDTNPSSILALTFTESGASAMKKRLISLIGETAYSVQIMTFHGFCSQVINSHPEFFPLALDSVALSDLDRYQIFEEIITQNQLEHIKPVNAPLLYVKAVMSNIQHLKREGVNPERFELILNQEFSILEVEGESWKKTERTKREKMLAKNYELLKLYQVYQQELKNRKRYDFEDMISLTVQAFQSEELLLLEYQERLQYFLIDEYQDTNSAQNQVIQLLASYWEQEANVFVVGDPNQSIYRFQGASLENTFGFLTLYPNATVITLKQNYRSTQLILDASKHLIDHQALPEDLPVTMEQTLIAQKMNGNGVILYQASSNTLEHVFIAETIKNLLSSGINPEEIAIIYRNNSESHQIADVLARWGIEYDIEGGSDILRHPTITQLLNFLQVIKDIRTSTEDVNLFTLLNYQWLHLNPLVILKSVRFSNEKRISLYSVYTNESVSTEFLTTLSETEKLEAEKVFAFARKLAFWSGLDSQTTFPQLFETIIKEGGFLANLLQKPNAIEQLNILNSLFSEIKRQHSNDHLLNLHTFLRSIEIMLEHNLSITETDLNIRESRVTLVTAHKSKGQEWGHVFITGLIDKKWGNTVSRNLIPLPEGILTFTKNTEENKNDDDRRLLYVALTRAKEQIYLTMPSTIQSGANNRETTTSVFLYELPSTVLQKVEGFEKSQDTVALLSKLLEPALPETFPNSDEREFINHVLEKFKLSVTGLNTYLECPYQFKLNILLRVPRVKAMYQSFGTAIHKALEFLFKYMKDQAGEIPTLNEVQTVYRNALEHEGLHQADFIIRLAQGNKLLDEYYQNYQAEFITPLFTEKPFGSGFSQPMLEDIALSGKVDKIELMDATNKTVKVIDYKTGKPKSRNEIEGKTQNSTGNYKRQLVFYKLLADLDRSFKMTVEQAEFDFVQPKDNGTFVKHSFTISNLEVDEMKIMIREVMTKIRNQEFPRTTDTSICKDCKFQFHCWPEGIGE